MNIMNWHISFIKIKNLHNITDIIIIITIWVLQTIILDIRLTLLPSVQVIGNLRLELYTQIYYKNRRLVSHVYYDYLYSCYGNKCCAVHIWSPLATTKHQCFVPSFTPSLNRLLRLDSLNNSKLILLQKNIYCEIHCCHGDKKMLRLGYSLLVYQ